MEDGGIESFSLVLLVVRGSPLLEFINDIIEHIIQSDILTHIKRMYFLKEQILSIMDDFVPNDTYTVFSIRHLQTAFYLLILGYVLAFSCFAIEIMCYRYVSKSSKSTRRHT
jgi:hypothetical protein